jgi:hypothetical protein
MLQDFVAPDFLADDFLGSIVEVNLERFVRFTPRLALGRFVIRQVGNKRLRFGRNGQHLLQTRPQRGIVPAGPGEVAGPVLGRQFPGGEIDGVQFFHDTFPLLHA